MLPGVCVKGVRFRFVLSQTRKTSQKSQTDFIDGTVTPEFDVDNPQIVIKPFLLFQIFEHFQPVSSLEHTLEMPVLSMVRIRGMGLRCGTEQI